MKNRKWLKLLLVLLAIVIMGVVFSCQAKPSDSTSGSDPGAEVVVEGDDLLSEETFSTSETIAETEEESPSSIMLCVHVCGCVKTPGVYYLEEGSRVHEAVNAAGGMTKKASADYINLAEKLTDGQRIYIPSVSETQDETFTLSLQETSKADEKVDINKAGVEELITLPGIGKTKANAIISYREKSGSFSDIQDIMNVSGIGESLYEKIKDYIKV